MTRHEPTDSSDRVALVRNPHLHLATNTLKGRGVFTSAPIPAGATIEVSPVLILNPVENTQHIEATQLYHYTFNWPTRDRNGHHQTTQAIVFGLGSMFNHSRRAQNVGWKRDLGRHVIVFRALRDVAAGEELCISYGDHLTFVDVDGPCGGEEEVEDDPLACIELATSE